MVDALTVGMLRVKNEARWIKSVLASLKLICDDVLVFDDHSTDGTPDICHELEADVIESEFEGLNEVRDKTWMLRFVEQHYEPDWVLHIDGDEELTPEAQTFIREITSKPAVAAGYSFRILYLWDRPDQIRVDGIYRTFSRGSLFNVERQPENLRFESKSANGFHCGNLPVNLNGAIVRVPEGLLHYGYMHREDRLRKFEFYNRTDPYNVMEDQYRHMILGDLPEYPATMKTKHGGPLQLQPL